MMSAVFAADAKTIYCLMPGRTGESGGWEYDRIIASLLTGISLILIIMIVIGSWYVSSQGRFRCSHLDAWNGFSRYFPIRDFC